MGKMTTDSGFLQWFYEASPYIRVHHGKTFVICVPGEAIDSATAIEQVLRDIAGISCLGIRVVLVHGLAPQIEACLDGRPSQYLSDISPEGLRVTDDRAIACVEQQAGRVRLKLEARLSCALAGLAPAGVHIRVSSGNFVTARPYGIHGGIDFCHTGIVRRVDADAVRHQLDMGAVVLVSPVGFSSSGEIFNLSCRDVAGACASALCADKLIILTGRAVISDSRRRLLRQLTEHEARELLHGRRRLDDATRHLLDVSVQAVNAGVRRVHVLRWAVPGAIVQELFTRDGVGTLISAEPFDTIRTAQLEDITGILQVIKPLEDSGVLVRRQRRRLELEIDHFLVAVRDGAVIGCAAVYPYRKAGMAELACLAMAPACQGSGSGDRLLDAAQQHAADAGIRQMFVLTTQAAHWFQEHGFSAVRIDDLPIARRRLYNYQRKSRIFLKDL